MNLTDVEKELKNECSICSFKGVFNNINGRVKARCPKCNSLERHRFFYLIYKAGILSLTQNIKLLHFAPERCFSDIFTKIDNIDYILVDIAPERYKHLPLTIKMDITNIEFEDNSFDFILSNHVLEHIPDDKKAIREMYRVLKHGEKAFISVPVFSKSEFTEEHTYQMTREERFKICKHPEHVRNCGLDYIKRLESAGFKVKNIKSVDIMNEDAVKKYKAGGQLFECLKP